MGLPAEGMASFYRNSRSDVIKYFGKFHKGKVKIYNLCDDKYIDTSTTSLAIEKNILNSSDCEFSVKRVPVAYFPMQDHNPGPLKMIFYFCLDALLFLSRDPENVIAVHCKAGKGRTGLAIAAYMVFMEGCSDAYQAVEQFNFRRTEDMKGLRIPSQIRYIHYFHNFLLSSFSKPYKSLLAQHVKDPTMHSHLFLPTQLLKLTSICIGPF